VRGGIIMQIDSPPDFSKVSTKDLRLIYNAIDDRQYLNDKLEDRKRIRSEEFGRLYILKDAIELEISSRT
jgi:hypothetical protein